MITYEFVETKVDGVFFVNFVVRAYFIYFKDQS